MLADHLEPIKRPATLTDGGSQVGPIDLIKIGVTAPPVSIDFVNGKKKHFFGRRRSRLREAVGIYQGLVAQQRLLPDHDPVGECGRGSVPDRSERKIGRPLGRAQTQPADDVRKAQPGNEVLLQKQSISARPGPSPRVPIRTSRRLLEAGQSQL